MFKKLRIPALALAGAMALAVPSMTLAMDHDDHRGRGSERQESVRGYDRQQFSRGPERREFSRGPEREWRDHDDRGFSFGAGVYRAPIAPAAPASGYYDAYGVWHPYGYYDAYGVWHAYGY